MRRFLLPVLVVCLTMLGACAPGRATSVSPAGSASADAGGTVEVTGQVTAGPTCPVVRDPPDPACDARPVPGATLVLIDEEGHEANRVTSAEDGSFAVRLAPGRYRLVPQPVDGLMGTAPEQAIRIPAAGTVDPVDVVYDTGIR